MTPHPIVHAPVQISYKIVKMPRNKGLSIQNPSLLLNPCLPMRWTRVHPFQVSFFITLRGLCRKDLLPLKQNFHATSLWGNQLEKLPHQPLTIFAICHNVFLTVTFSPPGVWIMTPLKRLYMVVQVPVGIQEYRANWNKDNCYLIIMLIAGHTR